MNQYFDNNQLILNVYNTQFIIQEPKVWAAK